MRLPAVLLILLSVSQVRAQGDYSRFLQVQGWKGTIKINMQSNGSNSGGDFTDTWSDSSGANITIALDGGFPAGLWTGTAIGNWSIIFKTVDETAGCTVTNTENGSGSLANDTFGRPRKFLLAAKPDGMRLVFDGGVTVAGSLRTVCPSGSTDTPSTQTMAFAPASLGNVVIPYPASGLDVTGSTHVTGINPISMPSFQITGRQPPELDYVVSWDLHPAGVDEIELVLSADAYEAWRPQGGPDERTPGNAITVRARLQNKDGSASKLEVANYILELTNVSRKKGVCINYPPPNKAVDDNDLQFDPTLNPGFEILGQFNSKAVRAGPGSQISFAVSSYDWGGSGNLTVSALLQDGRTITGRLQGASEDGMRLPKRAGSSNIADSWKSAHGIPDDSPDTDDKDSQPVGDGMAGDGLSLYEEYRGFYENGVHREGDPSRKDYFLVDLVGERAAVGLAVFKTLTNLQVHDKMLPSELSPTRVVNFNSSSPERLVEQHGIIMKTDPSFREPIAWSADESKTPGPPKNTDEVRIPLTLEDDPSSATPLNRGGLDYYDKAVAHELMHTVSVWHHGESDYKVGWYLVQPGASNPYLTPQNTWDRPRVYEAVNHDWIDVYLEDGRSVAPRLDSAPVWFIGIMIIGVQGGQHSGNEQCLMRYEFAHAYPSLTKEDARYIFSETSAGSLLCNSPVGTGANDRANKPQSRHGDAAPNRGDCIHQINVNDLANPVR